MTSRISEATKKDLESAVKFSKNIQGSKKNITSKMEDEGFRVIYRKAEKNNLPILMPSGKVLTWDMVPKSLNYLNEDSDEIEKATEYLAYVFSQYLEDKNMKFIEDLNTYQSSSQHRPWQS